jgi:hypothetical protein
MKPRVLIYKEIPKEVLDFIQESFDVDYFNKLTDFTDLTLKML